MKFSCDYAFCPYQAKILSDCKKHCNITNNPYNQGKDHPYQAMSKTFDKSTGLWFQHYSNS